MCVDSYFINIFSGLPKAPERYSSYIQRMKKLSMLLSKSNLIVLFKNEYKRLQI